MRPRLLDLFCGAGGCTKGYQRAGFYVVGVDIAPQPNYCGDEFYRLDALEALREMVEDGGGRFTLLGLGLGGARQRFDAIHASPPCPGYANVTLWRGSQADHPRLIAPTRALLERTGLPYVVENVRTRELHQPLMLCGSQFGLRVRRHRYFETNWPAMHGLQVPCQHSPDDFSFDHGGKQPESVYRDAMGCGWMTVKESRQAIPPAYCEWIGAQLLAHLAQEAAA